MSWLMRRKPSRTIYYCYRDGSGKEQRISLVTKNMPEAQKKQVELDELYEGVPAPKPLQQCKASDFFDLYAKHVGTEVSKSTLERREWAWNRSVSIFSPSTLSDITEDALKAYKASYEGNPVTFNGWLMDMRVMYGKALNGMGLLKGKNPFKAISTLTVPHQEVRVLSWDEIETLAWWGAWHFKTAQSEAWRTNIYMVFVLGGYFGLRAGEISAARWEHVDFKNSNLRVLNTEDFTTKNRKPRVVPLIRRARPWMEAERKAKGFIYNPDRSTPVSDFKRSFKTVCGLAGMPDVYPHLLRHSYISNRLADGHEMYKVALACGHSNARIQQIYSHAVKQRPEDLE